MELSASAELRSSNGGAAGACFFPFYQGGAYEAIPNRCAAAACNPAPSTMFPTFQQHLPMASTTQRAAAAARLHQTKKRKMLANDLQKPSLTLQNPANYSLVDLNHAHVCAASPPASHNHKVSTGLRLASFDEDGSTVTSSRPDTGSACANSEIAAQLLHQQNELRQLFVTHAEQLKSSLRERTQMHAQALLTTVEDDVSRRLREKDAELDRVKRQCHELEDRINNLALETYLWQNRARSYEGMVTVLRGNLQQALRHHSREHVKLEGYGDSDADDAASANIDENPDVQQSRTMMMMMEKKAVLSRACKRCRAKEVTILLLPCMHLCLCHDCKQDVERCPLCATPRSAFIEVYLS